MMNGNDMGMGGECFGFGFIFLLIVVAIIVIVVWIVKSKGSKSNSSNTKTHSPENHEATLKNRLAQGKISEEEYDRLKKKLNEK